MLKGFKDFILRGNVIDLAIAVVIGTAFGALVTALTDGFIQPLLNVFGNPDTGNLGFLLDSDNIATEVDVSLMIGAVINFLIVAAVIYFLIITPMQKLMTLRKKGEVDEVEAVTEDIALLQEIRDLLRAQAGPTATEGGTGPRPIR